MARLKEEIAAYEEMCNDLELEHFGEWVVFRDKKLAGTYDSFDMAAEDAVKRFGRGPYLIRKVGAPPLTLPASVLYRTNNVLS
ncbi:MAG: hypothetical protein OXC97_00225 [Candidatus Dadabacteria bacterium]|nr:hypothetical protein [Candidatus Dadabacteria bacterium]